MTRGLGELGNLFTYTMIGMVILAAGVMFYGELFDTYGVTEAYQNATDMANQTTTWDKINASTNQMAIDIKNSTSTGQDSVTVLFTGAFNAFNLVFVMLDAILGMFSATLTSLTVYGGLSFGVAGQIMMSVIVLFVVWRVFEAVTGRSI